MKIAVVGVTGLVGKNILKVLENRGFNHWELIPVASQRSIGKSVHFSGKEWTVCSIEDAIAAKPEIAIFSAGSKPSLQYAPEFAKEGTFVIDNSSAWRMEEHIPLIVPEINGATLSASDKIIANPNCSTIQVVMALAPLHQHYIAKRVVISTYQSVTGTGMQAVTQLMNEREGKEGEKIYPHPIDLNVIPQGGDFLENGYTTEEIKLVNETRKILNAPEMAITATVVRVPVLGGHSASVNITFEKDFELENIYYLLRKMHGVKVLDNPKCNEYPMPLMAEGSDEVFVGRVRRDESHSNSLNLWVVADNLRKGAATNAIQIAEEIIQRFF